MEEQLFKACLKEGKNIAGDFELADSGNYFFLRINYFKISKNPCGQGHLPANCELAMKSFGPAHLPGLTLPFASK